MLVPKGVATLLMLVHHKSSYARTLVCLVFTCVADKPGRTRQKKICDSRMDISLSGVVPCSLCRGNGRKRVLSTQGLAKAAWGWVCRLPPKVDREKINSAVRFALREALRAVLRGHSLDFAFRVLSSNFSAAQKQAWKRQGEPCRWARRGWPQVLQAAMSDLGWTGRGPWTWVHERLGFTVTVGGATSSQLHERNMHLLRESWRHASFASS